MGVWVILECGTTIKKIFLLIILLILLSIVLQFIFVLLYVNSYTTIELNRIAQCVFEEAILMPHWYTITNQNALKACEEKYKVDLPEINFLTEMLIISIGDQLISLEYNLKESTYHTRGHYIGFPIFSGEVKPMVYIYKTSLVPLFPAEIGGYPPEYMGKYRR